MAQETIQRSPGLLKKPLKGSSKSTKHNGSKMACKTCLKRGSNMTNSGKNESHRMMTRSITTSIPRNAVFNTFELLEIILLQLPNADLILVRGINKHWNAIIMTSPRILRRLFLLAEPVTTTWVLAGDATNVHTTADENGTNGNEGANWTIPGKLNDLLFAKKLGSGAVDLESRVKSCEPMRLLARPLLTNPHSIYRKMFVCQPPSKEILFHVYYDKSKKAVGKSRFYGDDGVPLTITNPDGVTFGNMLLHLRAWTGLGSVHQPYKGYKIKARSSTVWMAGVVFPTDQEMLMVKDSPI